MAPLSKTGRKDRVRRGQASKRWSLGGNLCRRTHRSHMPSAIHSRLYQRENFCPCSQCGTLRQVQVLDLWVLATSRLVQNLLWTKAPSLELHRPLRIYFPDDSYMWFYLRPGRRKNLMSMESVGQGSIEYHKLPAQVVAPVRVLKPSLVHTFHKLVHCI